MILLYMILFLAACADLKSFRIPNRLIVAGYLLGLIYQIIWSDQDAFFLYPIYAFFILLLTIPLFCMGAIGGGDCKLLSVCAMFTGIVRTIAIGVYAIFAAGAVSVILLAVSRLIFHKKYQNKLHFGIYILIGAILEHFLGGVPWVSV